ncbi:probable proline--tRNA ligase, mitochondrial isoform X2 [Stegodyphus dumicola]|nr:probable proline--tRNA ligase, mitochondrial isoform X2 [Stegodyphus dumicola]
MLQTVLGFSQKPQRMTQVFRYPESLPKEKAVASLSKSFKLMLNQGFIKPLSSGILYFKPLTVRSLEKLSDLADVMMSRLNAQKMLFPTLIQDSVLKKTGRWENAGLFKLNDRNSFSYCLGPTHEEVVTLLLSNLHISYRSLPLRFYQISTKFRDEMNPRLGLLRGREFIMKDMYAFDSSEENAKITYEAVCKVYSDFFQLLGVDALKVQGASGDMGGNFSHEFHLASNVGEDVIFYCAKCKTGINAELSSEPEMKCPTCDMHLQKCSAIEVGHAFLLGRRYSEPLQAKFETSNQLFEEYQMGSYGLGLTRILAACVECLSSVDNIRWPLRIAPYYLSLILPKKGSKEESVTPFAEDLSDSLNNINWLSSNVLIDDRTNLTIGKRVQESNSLGIPYVIVVGRSAQEELPRVEVIDMYKNEVSFLTHKETMDFFRSKNVFQSFV